MEKHLQIWAEITSLTSSEHHLTKILVKLQINKYINNIHHFNYQLMHTTLRNVRLL